MLSEKGLVYRSPGGPHQKPTKRASCPIDSNNLIAIQDTRHQRLDTKGHLEGNRRNHIQQQLVYKLMSQLNKLKGFVRLPSESQNKVTSSSESHFNLGQASLKHNLCAFRSMTYPSEKKIGTQNMETNQGHEQ